MAGKSIKKQKKDDIPASIYAIIIKFNTHEEYLNAQITEENLTYLGDEDVARRLVEFGYRGSGDVLQREQFYYWKRFADRLRDSNRREIKPPTKPREKISDEFLQALSEREWLNRKGELNTILFVRTVLKSQEISSYIDLAHRLATEDFEAYFDGRKKFLPKPDDLSFCNWATLNCVKNSTENYDVITEKLDGMQFRNKRDGQIIKVGGEAPGQDRIKIVIRSPQYLSIVIYDHIVKRKAIHES